MSVEVKNLTKKFGDQLAVNDISFVCKKGIITGLLGPNGAGKSTIMKIILGFLKSNEGKIFLNGQLVNHNDLSVRQKIGYLAEHNPLYLDMYVKEFLLFIANVYKLPNKEARVNEVIELVGLEKEKHKKIVQLSKGYRQRVGLAQAIIHDPEILILDEPTSGLDPNQLADIRKLIKKLGQEKTVIFSTHIMQEVQALCDRVIIIDRGKLIVNDDIENLTNYISGDEIFSVEFQNEINEVLLKRQAYITSFEKINNNKYLLHAKKDKDIRAELFDFAVNQKNRIIEIKKEESSVEDIFQLLTQKNKA